MSSVKPLCKSTELNRCIATDRRWKRKQASHSSPERLPNPRPSSLRNYKDEEEEDDDDDDDDDDDYDYYYYFTLSKYNSEGV